jgi:hypothetical protein
MRARDGARNSQRTAQGWGRELVLWFVTSGEVFLETRAALFPDSGSGLLTRVHF